MIRTSFRAPGRLALFLTVAGAVLVSASCQLMGLGQKSPWPTGKSDVAFTHVDVTTLNDGYARTKSSVLVRQIKRPTRAALDFAAYHANFMIADPPPEEAPPKGAKADPSNPFGGNIDKETLVADIARTPLTDSERTHPIAFAPAVEWLAAKKVAGADSLGDVAAAVRGESWGLAGGPQFVRQGISEMFIHAGDTGPAQLWVKIEFQPWFDGFGKLPDQDGDGFPEIYGRVKADLVNAACVEALLGEYSSKELTAAEVKGWANKLSSYWYVSYNTDLLPAGPVWPDDHTEADIRKELGTQTFASPTFVMRGKPQGKATYNIFIVRREGDDGKSSGAAGDGKPVASAPALKLAKTKPTPQPGAVLPEIKDELKKQGSGSWEKWAAKVKPFDEAVRKRLHAAPKVKGFAGSDGFLFFRNSMEYVAGGDLEKQPAGKNPLPIILEFKKELDAHGVDFLFVPVPNKEEIFPDELEPKQKALVGKVVNPYGRKFIESLSEAGVEVVDLLPSFLAARVDHDKPKAEPLYQRQDTHWTDRGLRLAADIISARVKKYPWYHDVAAHAHTFSVKETSFTRFGDLHSRLPDALKKKYKPETLAAHQVIGADGALYDDDADSPIVVLGDSFTGVYELTDAEHAGVSAHIAKGVSYPVDLVMSYGGGPNVRQKLMRRGAAALDSKKLVIWMMTARDLYNYWENWEPLSTK
ncbi:MAG TPA: hypothetical protein VH374_23600 [Polyangia bacterium]|jgi:alginate O-acetyltransferase complex protein AlgJ|nr:hypothetical protein [Polyangia bacterium]